jgi:signal transduction histidine kinase
LGRVLLNLTTNALKFTDEGYVEIGVQHRSRSLLEFYVRDTGRGISAERQSELFQPFKKRPSREGHFFSGSGVGLSIARRLVRSMGSDLVLETAPGWGTRFSFVIDVPQLH